ncbi:C2 domain-containing protein 5 isoform X1 [Nymphalis io]|uniref:C2 domain-containing protein 5 isoform X1 n=1 Tax=Inachis io TaxID=171585 RepID=UPI002169BD90|nr:C2 domain-containing protein 5 isoform X1 [Nymphalis io]XP_050354660.1 C2 domain-containing protein 5 isoform X1 [Nymphalis io]
MPGKIKVKVLAGRNLPVMDRASDTTDAFVEIKFGGVTHKTDVCRKSLNPQWNSTEWYRFEVDESELQDEPLQLRLMDHDTYSANDAIGKVVISLAPLLAREANNANGTTGPPGGAVMSGWIPVFDTMHGIRGELNVIVKVELFSDFNKYKTSSCGVQFFHCPMIPPGYRATTVHGFVEELIVNDDPEYQWIDKIRTPRASNEARQVAFIKLSNQVQRLVGLKAAELGANAVVGYQQDFDLEGEAGVVARAIGTAVSIMALPTPSYPTNIPCTQQQLKKYLDILATDEESITDLNQYYQNHQEELQRIVSILNPNATAFLDEGDTFDDDDKSLDLSAQKQSTQKTYTGDLSIYQDDYVAQKSLKHLSEDQIDLNKLLNREDPTDSAGPLKTIKKIKDNLFSKKFNRRFRKPEMQDDQVSLQSTSSDTSRISLTDIKNEIKKIKKLKVKKLLKVENKEEEGYAMASILARSVMHADRSLARISEHQDSESSPCSTLRRTTSESEPVLNLSDEDGTDYANKNRGNVTGNIPEIHCSSLENIKNPDVERERKISGSCPPTPVAIRSDNLLKLPGEVDYFGSISSALSADSSEIDTSSDEDDESYGMKSDLEPALETTSSVVQSVLSKDVDPNFIAQMEKKLTVLELTNNDTAKKIKNVDDNLIEPDDNNANVQMSDSETVFQKENTTKTESAVDPKPSPARDHTCVTNSNSHTIKMHNPFTHRKASKSISAPSSPIEKKGFMYRSSKRIKRQISKISKSSMIKSLSHYSLLPKKKHLDTKTAMSQPGSASDVTSKAPSETVLGSPFLSYTDLLSLDKEGYSSFNRLHKSDEIITSKVSMYIGSEPVSRASLSGPSSIKDEHHFYEQKPLKKDKFKIKPTGLIQTAMETILIDKVESLLLPTSPDPIRTEDQKFFADVNEKLEKVEEAQTKERINNNDVKENEKNQRKLVRQDSIRSAGDTVSSKMSKVVEPNVIPCKLTHTPVLQHFHPILSGAPLETIPSLPEGSVDRTESLDVEGVEPTNSVSVCCNSHAACGVDRSERERDKYDKDKNDKEKGSPRHARHESYGGREPPATAPVQSSSLHSSSTPMGIHRRSSDSDLSVTPKGNSLNASGNTGSGGGAILRPSMNSNNIDMLEYPFLTMTEYPPGFIVHIGGTVCARSVKLVDGGGESAARAAWWAELRTELRAHARALRCTAVLAYTERAAVREDVCVLSASGTAAVINLDCDFTIDESTVLNTGSKNPLEESEIEPCSVAHVPYSPGAGPYRAELATCGGCRRARVPSVLLATCAKPNRLASYPKAITLTAVAARGRRAVGAEAGARDLSDQLPFLEYELHKLLLAKLRMQGANAIFSLQTQIAIGERSVLALASGTALRLAALPAPAPPTLKVSENDKNAIEIQKALWDTFVANKAANGYDIGVPELSSAGCVDSEGDDAPALDLCADKDACVLELDEAEDVETARALCVRRAHMCVLTTAQRAANAPPHAFTQVWRARLGSGGASAERLVACALGGAAYKLRRLQPAALAATCFQLDAPEDEIQLVVSGTAIPLLDPSKVEHSNGTDRPTEGDDDIFALDEEQLVKTQPEVEDKSNAPCGVSLSTLGGAVRARASRRVCALRLLFVRETTAVRELGGLSGFLHTFTCEVLAIARAYAAALGGNALTSLYLAHLLLHHNAHKNQGQCLLSVGGDVVHVTY